jgi:hypothetical protein
MDREILIYSAISQQWEKSWGLVDLLVLKIVLKPQTALGHICAQSAGYFTLI